MADNPTDIPSLLLRYTAHEPLSDADVAVLAQWLHSVDRQAFTDTAKNIDARLWNIVPMPERLQRSLEQKLDETDHEQVRLPAARVHRVHFLRTGWRKFAAAAAVMILIAGASYLLFHRERAVTIQPDITVVPTDAAPGKAGAILKLGNGRVIDLDTASNGALAGNMRKGDEGLLVQGGPDSAAIEWNTLETPRARTMHITLADGTDVWLNAGSSIRFPNIFAGNRREVEITGEAYFEVKPLLLSKDFPEGQTGKVPFIVRTPSDRIEVLGTHFNINAYADEGAVKTTLLEGSVRVVSGNAQRVIAPGQQFSAGSVKKVNTQDAIAWKNGIFVFRNAGLQEVMRQLARWYDVEVEYKAAVSGGAYEGEIGRDLTLSQVLKGLEVPRARITLDEGKKKIIIE